MHEPVLTRKNRLLGRRLLSRRIRELGGQIREELASGSLAGEEPVMVVVLKGGFVFAADLLRAIQRPLPVVFALGRGPRAPEELVMTEEDRQGIRGRHLIVVDVLVDGGEGMRALMAWLWEQEAASVRLAVLLHRSIGSLEPLPIDFLGFEVPNVRLVGYGLDERQRHRGLRGVHAWPEEG